MAIEKVNAMFDTDISVELNSSWADVHSERLESKGETNDEVQETGNNNPDDSGDISAD